MTYKEKQLLLIIIFYFPKYVIPIWPPPYKINLSEEETFVISEIFGSDEVGKTYDEDEMINKNQLQSLKLETDSDKYFRIHQLAMKHNANAQHGKTPRYYTKFKEINFDIEEPVPWKGGFVDKSGNYLNTDNSNVYYSNAMVKYTVERTIDQKREEIHNVTNVTGSNNQVNYDYSELKAEYGDEIEKEKGLNQTVHLSEVKEEETLQEAVNSMVDFKKAPRNCTAEEMKGIGFAAAECFWIDFKKADSEQGRWKFFNRIKRIIIIWFSLYTIIAIPCWCQKGWCCCCFQCSICKPQKRIDEAKKFIADNPVGVFHTAGNEKVTYKPTIYEQYVQKKLKHVLLKL